MPDVAEQSAKPPRTWRPMALWSAAILVALGLAWFVGAVAWPIWQVDRVLAKYQHGEDPVTSLAEVVRELGGQSAAARKLGVYLAMPDFVARRRWLAASALVDCGAPGVPLLRTVLTRGDEELCSVALRNLLYIATSGGEEAALSAMTPAAGDRSDAVRETCASYMGSVIAARKQDGTPVPEEVTRALVGLLADPAGKVRSEAADALGNGGLAMRSAVPALERLVTDPDAMVRTAAAEALEKIKGEELPK